MKLQPRIKFSLILILASASKGQTWNLNVTRKIHTETGSDVTIPCTLTYPPKYHTENVQLYWKIPVRSKLRTHDKDFNSFIFHPNDSYVVEKYRGKTFLINNTNERDCSLKILKIKDSEPNIYLRVIAKKNYSFTAEYVSISVSGVDRVTTNSEPMKFAIYAAVAAAVLILSGVVGFIFFRKLRRSQTLIREESRYYANFHPASASNKAKTCVSNSREPSKRKQDNKKPREMEGFGEPVYSNLRDPTIHMNQEMDERMDQMENIYANVDYFK